MYIIKEKCIEGGSHVVIVLFFINVIGAFVVLLSTSMLQNHFHKIEHSMEIYNSTKTYKPESQINFITKVLEKYREVRTIESDMMNVEAMITNLLYQEKIGHFNFLKVYSIATKGKIMLWSVLVGQVTIELIVNISKGSIVNFSFIIANTILCMLITLAQIIKAIDDKKEHLVVKVNDYITNTHPLENAFKERDDKIKELMGKLEQLEQQELDKPIGVKPCQEEREGLREEDIIELISNFGIK